MWSGYPRLEGSRDRAHEVTRGHPVREPVDDEPRRGHRVTAAPASMPSGVLEAALWRLLCGSERQDGDPFLALLDETAEAFAGGSEPRWDAWRSALAARR